jgi:FkbM family methyltransferase
MLTFLRRAPGRLARLLGRIGLDIRPLTAAGGRLAGLRMLWRADEGEARRGAIVSAAFRGKTVRFFVANDRDALQSVHRGGRFYEEEELDIIARHFRGGVFVDVGANVGNHTLYALLFLGARKAIAFEPQPEALAILDINLRPNGLADRVEVHGLGLGDAPGRAAATLFPDNLAGTRLSPAPSGPFELARGDDLLGGEEVTFIKIDTEGFELRVLEGLRETLRRCRPPLFVEVENEHLPAFEAFCASVGYRTGERYRRYGSNINIVAVPE